MGRPQRLGNDQLSKGPPDRFVPAPPELGLSLLVPVDHVSIRPHDDDAIQGGLKNERQNRLTLGGWRWGRGAQLPDARPSRHTQLRSF